MRAGQVTAPVSPANVLPTNQRRVNPKDHLMSGASIANTKMTEFVSRCNVTLHGKVK